MQRRYKDIEINQQEYLPTHKTISTTELQHEYSTTYFAMIFLGLHDRIIVFWFGLCKHIIVFSIKRTISHITINALKSATDSTNQYS